jgi:hypothetical protein
MPEEKSAKKYVHKMRERERERRERKGERERKRKREKKGREKDRYIGERRDRWRESSRA